MAREKRIVKIGDVVGEPFDTEWYTLAANSASLGMDRGVVDDSTFESFFSSNQTTIRSWTTSIQGWTNRGVPGYHATVKRQGSTIPVIDEPLSSTDGLTWEVDRERSVWQVGSVVVYEDGIDITPDVSIDYLQGRVFSSTPLSDVTVDFTLITLVKVCDVNEVGISLGLSTQDITTFCTSKSAHLKKGWASFSPEMKIVEISMNGFETSSLPWAWDGFKNGDEVIVEVDVNGDGSCARGSFILQSKSLSGDVGQKDVRQAAYTLSNKSGMEYPFSWYFPSTSNMPKAVQVVLDGWMKRKEVGVAYKGLSSTIWHGGYAFPESVDIDVDVNGISQISMSFQGTGIKDKQDEEAPESLILNFVAQSYEIKKSPLISGAMI